MITAAALSCAAALVGFVAFAMTSAAAPRGAVDFTPHGTQPGLSKTLLSSQDCAFCHRGDTEFDQAFMPYPTWSGSMMANAARDPLFWAALDVANRDVPGVGDYCLRCHTPNAWFAGRVSKTAGGTTIDGSDGCRLRSDHDNPDGAGNDFEGISCHYCHRQMRTGPGGETARRENANAWVDDAAMCGDVEGPCRRGPYTYPDPDVGPAQPPHGWLQSDLHTSSTLCQTCHDVTTPITNEGPLKTLIVDGVDTDIPFPIERTYGEWASSAYGDPVFVDGFATEEPSTAVRDQAQTCQDCHMRKSEDPFARACQFFSHGTRVGNLPVHEFAGANAWMPQVLSALYGSGLGRVAAFARTVTLANELLTARTADVAVSIRSNESGATSLSATVRVTNRAGHKLPTGYAEGRRMWLDVEARDANDVVIWRSGAYDDATGTLTVDPQLRVYEVRQGIWSAEDGTCRTRDGNGSEEFHFVLNDCIAKDTRIPPLGFFGGDDPELRPVPADRYATLPGDGSRLVNYDLAPYEIPLPAGVALPVRVVARLRHQVATREYVEFLRNEAVEHAIPSENAMCLPDRSPLPTGPRTKTRGQFMFDLWTTYGRAPPVTIDTAEASTP